MNEFERQWRVLRNQIKRFTEENFSTRPARKAPNLKMCPACGRFVGAGASVCEYCDSVLDPKRQGDVSVDGGQIIKISPVAILGLICITMYIGSAVLSQSRTDRDILSSLFSPQKVFMDLGAMVGVWQLLSVQPWRLVTYAFLHGGIMHLLMNMSALGYLGPSLWEHLGTRRFWLISLGTAIGGAVFSLVLWPLFGRTANAVGFSGALFGYIGALWGYYRHTGRFSMAEEYRRQFVYGMLICLLLSFAGMGIDHFAHLGGALTGWAMVQLFYAKWFRRLGDTFERAVLLALFGFYGWGLVAIALAIRSGGLFGY